MSDSADPSVNGHSGSGAVNAGSASSGVTAELKNEIQKIVMGVFKAHVPNAVRAAIGEALPDAIRSLGELQGNKPEHRANGDSNPADAEKTTQKARIEALEKQLQDFRKQAQEAESRAKDERLRSRVQAEIAKYLPASDPNHAAYMSHLYDVTKRFGTDEHGNPIVKFKRDGYEDAAALDVGVKELFEGEYKHLVQRSQADKLPTSGIRSAIGQPMANGKPGPARANPLDQMLSAAAASALRGAEGKE